MTVSMQLHLQHDDVASWASRRGGSARTATARMLTIGAENRAATAEVAIRLHGLRGSIEAIRTGSHGEDIANTRTRTERIGFGSPLSYRGLVFLLRG